MLNNNEIKIVFSIAIPELKIFRQKIIIKKKAEKLFRIADNNF